MFLCAIIISVFIIELGSGLTIFRISPLQILLLAWVKLTVVEFNSEVVFSEVGRTICLHGPK